jgi:hypothetical protein
VMEIINKSIIQYDKNSLQEEVKLAKQQIARIKEEVSVEWDNINHPVPILEMVPVACRDTSDESLSTVGS